MEQNRCIFCMHVIHGADQLCPACKKGIWEYQWKNTWLEPGLVLQDRYSIGAVLGEGAGSVTYMGYDLVLEQRVVVKEYTKDVWDRQKGRDARLLFGRFDVRGLAIEKEYFIVDEKGYVITEYLPGGTLKEYLQTHKKTEMREAVDLLTPVMEAVAFLHSIGIVHGAIHPEHLVFHEEGRLCIVGTGDADTESMEENSPYIPPEQLEGRTGPWTDIYAVCAVLYEMVTGRKVPPAGERIKKDRLKKLTADAELETEGEAVMQGLSLDVQMRYFSVGNFAEQFGVQLEAVQRLEGVIRQEWGEEWLQLTTQTDGKKYWEQQHRRKVRWRRIAVLAGVILCLAGGGAAFLGTHQDMIFQYKLRQAQKEAEEHKRVKYLTKDGDEYQAVRTFVETYGEYEESTSNGMWKSYAVPEDALEQCRQLRGTYDTFYLDKKAMLDALSYYMNIKNEDLNLTDHMYYDTARIFADETETMKIWIWKEEKYAVDYGSMGEEIAIGYDIMNEQVKKLEFHGTKERCGEFLVKMIPLTSPETYLTSEEAKDLLEACKAGEQFCGVKLNAKCRLIVRYSGEEKDTYEVTLSVPED